MADPTIEVTDVFYVAQREDGSYVVEDREFVGKTKSIWKAKRFYNPTRFVAWIGGGYKQYKTIKVHIRKTLTLLGEEAFPSEEELDKQIGYDP